MAPRTSSLGENISKVLSRPDKSCTGIHFFDGALSNELYTKQTDINVFMPVLGVEFSMEHGVGFMLTAGHCDTSISSSTLRRPENNGPTWIALEI